MKNFIIIPSKLAVALVLCLAANFVRAAVAPAISVLPPVAAQVQTPTRIATDASGKVYVVDSAAGRVVVMDAFNRVIAEKTGFRTPLGIAVDVSGNIYVGEADTGSVTVFDPQWNPLSQLGAGAGEFGLPNYLAIDGGTTPATVYVSDSPSNQLKAYQGGTLVRSLGGPDSSSARFDFPAGVWVNAAGDVFCADQNHTRVLVFDRSGAFLRSFNLGAWSTPGFIGRPAGIAGDASGRIFVADTFQDFVKAFDEQGGLLATFSGYGDAAGQVRSPAGLVVDSQGRLLVASPNTGRVEVFGLDCFTQLSATPANQSANVGATVTFSAQPGCGGPFTFQWRKGASELADGGIITGATNATLTLAGVAASDAGTYSVAITGPEGVSLSPVLQLAIILPPVLTSSPASRTVAPGTTVAMNAAATSSNLVWRWFYNGFELFIPNTNSFVLTNVQFTTAGKYWAVATNSAGSVTTAQATLTVMAPPLILTGPTNLTIAEHATATFTALGGGGTPLSYQWFLGASALTGQTSPTLVFTNATPARNGSYYVRVANAVGTTNTPSATLTVQADTVAPVALVADGGAATSRTILISFSEALNVASAQQTSKYQLLGPGGLTVTSAIVTNSSRVRLTLSGNRNAGSDYALLIQDVVDAAYTPNTLSPNPTLLSVQIDDAFGTVAWWPLNEASGIIARDASGNGFDGTVESATWTTGRSGSSVNLDGTAGDVVIPALNLNTNTVTISAWVRRSGSQPSSAGIVFTRAGNSAAGLRFGSTNELRYNWNDLATNYNYSSGLVVPDGVWTFTALVIEPARAILYLNSGAGLRSATNAVANTIEEFNGVSYFGYDTYATTRRFKGALDEIRICNRALSAAEIQSLYTAVAVPATCAIAAPLNGAVVTTANPTLLASVVSNGNPVNKVEFFSGTTFLGTARSAPYALVWSNLVSGAYSVSARAWYGPANYSATSSVASFTVAVPIISTLTLADGTLTLQWSGGLPPYQVQMTTNLTGAGWENVGPSTNGTSLAVQPGQDSAFYRVVGH